MKFFLSKKAFQKLRVSTFETILNYQIDEYCWRIDYFEEFQIFMATNEKTLFTKFFSAFVRIQDIAFSLYPTNNMNFTICKSVNRKVIGSMTEMKFLIFSCYEMEPEISIQKLEDYVNSIIYSYINYSTPKEEHEKIVDQKKINK